MARPPLYKNAKELQAKIDEFINNKSLKQTISGLCYHLGYASRQSFYDLEKKEEYAYTVKRARLWIETHYEELLFERNCVGAIFALKNFGWEDTQSFLLDDKRKLINDLFPSEEDLNDKNAKTDKP